MASAALLGAVATAPLHVSAEQEKVVSRVEKLEERMRDVEARLAKAEAMVNQHAAHGGSKQQPGMAPGSKGMGSGGMMDDDMMGMPDPAPQGQANPPGGGMGGHM